MQFYYNLKKIHNQKINKLKFIGYSIVEKVVQKGMFQVQRTHCIMLSKFRLLFPVYT